MLMQVAEVEIQCDLQKPACNRCAQSGRECEGYDRFPVFLNRTIEGPQKRHGLEEAKTPSHSRAVTPSIGDQGLSSTPSMLSSVSFLRSVSEQQIPIMDNRLLLQPSSSASVDQQFISAFWERYVPRNPRASDSSGTYIWLEQVIRQPDRGEASQLSIQALALTRLGWINNDDSLAQQGIMWYVRALQSVQKALWRDNAASNDDLFVAGYILAVYEVITFDLTFSTDLS